MKKFLKVEVIEDEKGNYNYTYQVEELSINDLAVITHGLIRKISEETKLSFNDVAGNIIGFNNQYGGKNGKENDGNKTGKEN